MARKKLAESFARVLKAAGVKHTVYLSSMAAHANSGTGQSSAQQRRTGSADDWAAGDVRARGVLHGELGARLATRAKRRSFAELHRSLARNSMVATRDIGTTAARALLDGPRGTRIIELGGPAEVSPAEVATTLGKLLGRDVNVVEVPLEVSAFAALPVRLRSWPKEFRDMYRGPGQRPGELGRW